MGHGRRASLGTTGTSPSNRRRSLDMTMQKVYSPSLSLYLEQGSDGARWATDQRSARQRWRGFARGRGDCREAVVPIEVSGEPIIFTRLRSRPSSSDVLPLFVIAEQLGVLHLEGLNQETLGVLLIPSSLTIPFLYDPFPSSFLASRFSPTSDPPQIAHGPQLHVPSRPSASCYRTAPTSREFPFVLIDACVSSVTMGEGE